MTSRLILSYVEREGGRDAVRALLERTGLEGCEEQLRDESRWFSFTTKIALFDAAEAVLGTEHVAEGVGRAALDLDTAAGPKRVLRALGTPGLVYRNVVRAARRLSSTHRMTLDAIGDGWARIRYEDVSGTGSHRHDCDHNAGLLAAVPELFGLPPARVAHPACALRGDAACVYEVRWEDHARGAAWAPSLSAAGATAAGAAGLAGAAAAAPVGVALAATAAALGARNAVQRARARRPAERVGRLARGDTERARRRAALDGVLARPDALQVHFQPVVALATGRVVGYEALARFPTLPDGRPDHVFAAAHDLGVGPELEAHAIRSALDTDGRPPGATLAVNASLSALASPSVWEALPDDLAGVVVEITEHELYESGEQLDRNLARLRDRGARIAVDDAGAGYAGLQQLVRVRPDVVKLDRSLVDGVAEDPAKAAMIAALTDFARSTGASVCAEGVERFDDLQLLAALDVNTAQGFLLARPAPGWPEVPPEVASLAAGRASGGVRQVGAPVRRRGEAALDARIDALERLVADGDARAAMHLVAEAAGAERARLFALDEHGETARELGRGVPVPLDEWPACRGVLESGAAGQLLAHDPLADPSEVGRLRAAGYGAALLVPIVARGAAIGVVEALRRREESWHREDADRLRVLARQLAPLVGGARVAATVA